MPSMPSRPWPPILTLVGIVVLVVAWCVYWFAGASFVRGKLDSELARLSARGVTISCKATDWSGFPFRFERDCLSPSLTVEGDSAVASRLLLVMQAYMPNRAILLIDGPVTTGAGIAIEHERAMASLRFSSETSWQASLEIPKARIRPFGGAERVLISARDTGGETLDFALDIGALEPMLAIGAPMRIDELSLSATLPRAALTRDILGILSRTGAKLGVVEARFRKDDLVLTARGEIGISPQGHVDGRLVTVVNRLDLLLAELKQTFGLSDADAADLATMIGLLQPGKTSDVTLDLIAKDGKLYWGPLMLTDLPKVL